MNDQNYITPDGYRTTTARERQLRVTQDARAKRGTPSLLIRDPDGIVYGFIEDTGTRWYAELGVGGRFYTALEGTIDEIMERLECKAHVIGDLCKRDVQRNRAAADRLHRKIRKNCPGAITELDARR